jgi:hypothetical protein
MWQPDAPVSAGTSNSETIGCEGNGGDTVTLTYFDVPFPPTIFSGITSPGYYSQVEIDVPGTAQYSAALSLTSGAVNLAASSGSQVTLASSSANVALGTLNSGIAPVTITAQGGPPAAWTLSVQALPVAISAVAFAHRLARAGNINTLSYTTSGDTAITATLASATGNVVRQLSSGLSVGVGAHSLTWDGLDENGNPVPDGHYTAALQSIDPSGLTNQASTTVLMDSHPPRIHVISHSYLGPHQTLVVRVTPAVSGVNVRARLVTANLTRTVGGSSGTLTVRPPPGYRWKRGRHTFTVTATDTAGNSIRYVGHFTVT